MPRIEFVPSNTPKDFQFEVRRDNVPGLAATNVQGHADGMGTSFQGVWGNSALHDQKTIYDTPAKVKVASTSTADDGSPAGTGTQTVLLTGYDSSNVKQTETITLNGTTEVESALTYKAVTGLLQTAVGTGLKNAGDLWVGTGTFTTGVPATKFLFMELGDTVQRSGMGFVAAGHKHWLIQVFLMIADTNKSLQVHLMIYDGTHERRVAVFEQGSGNLITPSPAITSLGAGILWWTMGKVNTGSADVVTIMAYNDETL